ncbi:MAG TPA: hypothetical protein VHR86_04520 [Armatimonadota bacterium]|nr:hypothetical protein [Armatimonadota bacterium]
MKAVVYKGADRVAIENIEDPRIESPNDAIVRITSTAICGSDLHMPSSGSCRCGSASCGKRD